MKIRKCNCTVVAVIRWDSFPLVYGSHRRKRSSNSSTNQCNPSFATRLSDLLLFTHEERWHDSTESYRRSSRRKEAWRPLEFHPNEKNVWNLQSVLLRLRVIVFNIVLIFIPIPVCCFLMIILKLTILSIYQQYVSLSILYDFFVAVRLVYTIELITISIV